MTVTKSNKHLTFSHNISLKRHGVLRLTPAYSTKLVNEILDSCDNHKTLLDPYCGTATTALSGGQRGMEAYTTDINPFLIWLGKTKTKNYAEEVFFAVSKEAENIILSLSFCEEDENIELPDICNIERWWSRGSLYVLSKIKSYIEKVDMQEEVSDLLKLSFCRTLISVSNAAFNHQSMSFKDEISNKTYKQDAEHAAKQFKNDTNYTIAALSEKVELPPKVILADAREIDQYIKNSIDIVITSPPYPNRMSYIRELRPYMYWLGFLKDSQDAADLDWLAIGGTWGSATSRVGRWKTDESYFIPLRLDATLKRIENTGEKNSFLLANYVGKYFYDMWQHLESLSKVVSFSHEINYIVGNSTYYSVLVDVEEIFADMMRELNLGNVTVTPIRKRNSKKELYEYIVRASR